MSDIAIIAQAAQAAARRYPWYARLLQDRTGGQSPPLLTGTLLEQHLYAQPSITASDDTLSAYRTSGTSTGMRKTIYYSEADEQRYISIKAKLFQDWLHANGSMNSAPVCNVMVDMGTGHAAATALEVFASMGLNVQALPFTLPIDQHVK